MSKARILLIISLLSWVQPLAAQETVQTAVNAGAVADADASTSSEPKADASVSDAAPAEGTGTKSEPLPWDLLHRRYATWSGPTGGLFLVDASNGEIGALRLSLGMSTFSGDSVLYKKDHVEQDEKTLSVSWTALRVLEVYASLLDRSTAVNKPAPQSQSSMGDVSLGLKVSGKVAPLLYLGGDLRALFANQVGGGGSTLGATSLGLRSELSVHLEELAEPVPLIARLNVGYLFDNSAKLVTDIEDDRYTNLNGAKNPQNDETRHLVNRFERLAMGINRLDRFSIGVGAEVPVEVTERFYLHPLLEWRIDVPVNRQGYDCPFVKANKKSGSINTTEDTCYERKSGATLPMNLALGVRAVPPIRGVSVTLAADFGLSGTSTFARELAPNLPYRLMLQLAYDYDARPVAPPPAPPAPEVKPAPVGRIQGLVTSSAGGPVAGAIVTFVDHDVSAVASSSDGHFVSEAFAPGEVHLEVSHPDYEPSTCATVIPPGGGNVEAQCLLTPKPAPTTALRGRVLDAWGSPVSGARIDLNGPASNGTTSDIRGQYEVVGLSPGEYMIKIHADGFFLRLTKLTIEPKQNATFDFTLMAKPIEPSIALNGTNVVAKKLKFVGNDTELDDAGAASVAELADLMLTRPELSIRIQGYGDDAVALSRALLIKQRLVDAGVPERRIEAIGGGKGRMQITVNP